MSCTPYTERDSSSGPNALQVRDLRSPLKLISLREGDGVDVLSLPGHRKKKQAAYKLLCQGIHNRVAQNIWTGAQFMGAGEQTDFNNRNLSWD